MKKNNTLTKKLITLTLTIMLTTSMIPTNALAQTKTDTQTQLTPIIQTIQQKLTHQQNNQQEQQEQENQEQETETTNQNQQEQENQEQKTEITNQNQQKQEKQTNQTQETTNQEEQEQNDKNQQEQENQEQETETKRNHQTQETINQKEQEQINQNQQEQEKQSPQNNQPKLTTQENSLTTTNETSNKWYIKNNELHIGALTIPSDRTYEGTFNPEGYTSSSSVPWYNYRSSVNTAIIEETCATVKSTAYWFSSHTALTLCDISRLNTNQLTNCSCMFYSCSGLTTTPDVSNWNTNQLTNCSSMFGYCSGLTTPPDVSNWNTSSLTNCSSMFSTCSGLTTPPDVSNWNTSSLTKCSQMFSNCSGLTTPPDVSNWNTSQLTTCASMFSSCSGLITPPDVSNWNTSKLTNCLRMFQTCSKLASLDLSNWDMNTSHLTSKNYMFSGCYKLSRLVLGAKCNITNTSLPNVSTTSPFTGYWKKYDASTGSYTGTGYTSTNLMKLTGSSLAGTWEWENLHSNKWYIKNNELHIGALTIPSDRTYEGTFKPEGYTSYSSVPWYNYRLSVKTAIIEETCPPVKSTANWFYYHTNMTSCNTRSLDTSNLTNCDSMFYSCSGLTTSPDFSEWDTSSLKTCQRMFYSCSGLTTSPDVSNWNTSKLTNCSYMFYSCSGLTTPPNISEWDTNKLINCSYMFYACSGLTTSPDVSNWNTSQLKNCSYMFSSCSKLTTPPDVSNWNTNQLTDCSSMFSNCSGLTTPPDVSEWDTSSLTTCLGMFYYCSGLTTPPDVSNWNTSQLTNCRRMFTFCSGLTTTPDVSNWNTSSITICSEMFYYCSGLTAPPNVSNWDTSNLTNCLQMFGSCSGLTTPPNISEWDTSKLTNCSYMFYACSGLTTSPDVSNWNTSQLKDCSFMFRDCSKLESLDLSNWDMNTSHLTSKNSMFSMCSKLSRLVLGANCNIKSTDLPSVPSTSPFTGYWKKYDASTGSYTGTGYSSTNLVNLTGSSLAGTWEWENWHSNKWYIKNNELHIGAQIVPSDRTYEGTFTLGWYTNYSSIPWYSYRNSIHTAIVEESCGPVNRTANWFRGYTSLTSCDMSKLDTTNLTRCEYMFHGCSNLESVNVSGWNTINLADCSWMFSSCSKLTTPPDVSNWNTNQLTDCSSMFSNCSGLTTPPDISEWNTSNLTTCSCMFNLCSGLTATPDVSNWNTSKLTNCQNMFSGCSSLESADLSNWNTTSLTSCYQMFKSCSNLESLDLSNWDMNTSHLTSKSEMLTGCSKLSRLVLGEDCNITGTGLLNVSSVFPYTSYWKKVDTSTGEYVSDGYTTANLVNLTGSNLTGTWEWEKLHGSNKWYIKNNELHIGAETIPSDRTYEGTFQPSGYGYASNTNIPWYDYRSSINTAIIEETCSPVMKTVYWFYQCTNMTSCDTRWLDTSRLTDCTRMFYSCSKLESLDLANWDMNTSHLTSKSNMFAGCSKLSRLVLGANCNIIGTGLPNVSSIFPYTGYWKKVDTSTGEYTGIGYTSTSLMSLTSFNLAGTWEWEKLPGSNKWYIKNNELHIGAETIPSDRTYEGTFNPSGYTSYSSIPWYSYRSSVNTAIIEETCAPVKSTAYWFSQCTNMTLCDTSWLDTSQLTTCYSMFDSCRKLTTPPDVSSWNTSQLKNCANMFYNCSGLTTPPDISEWNTSQLTDCSYMFQSCSGLTTPPDVSGWDTSQLTTCYSMFYSCSGLAAPPDVSNWNTSQLTTCSTMFRYCSSLTAPPNVSSWNTSQLKTCSYMFQTCRGLTTPPDVSEWNTSSLTDCSYMFQFCSGLTTTPDVSNWNTSQLKNCANMFCNCSGLTTTPDVSEWNTSQLTICDFMFSGCSGLTTPPDVSEWNTSSLTNCPSMFSSCSGLTTPPDVSEWNTSNLTTCSGMFSSCSGLTTPPDISNWDTSKLTTCSSMFSSCSGLTTPPDVSEWNTSKLTTCSSMFSSCSGLTAPPDVSNWNTSKLTNCSSMFYSCYKLESLNLSNWDMSTSHLTNNNKNNMFTGCSKLSRLVLGTNCNIYGTGLPDASMVFPYNGYWKQVNTSTGEYIGDSYTSAGLMNLTGSSLAGTWEWDKISGSNKWYIKNNELHIGAEIIPSDRTYEGTFQPSGYTSYSSIPWYYYRSSVNTVVIEESCAPVKSTAYWFYQCTNMTLCDTRWLDTSRLTDCTRMFYSCSKLESLDLANWDMNTSHLTNKSNMLTNCSKLSQLVLGANCNIAGTGLPSVPTTSPFTGYWKQVDTSTGEYIGDGYTSAGLMNLTGSSLAGTWEWEAIRSHTISFVMNGHGSQIEDLIVDDGTVASEPSNPSCKGYSFEGWFTDEDCTSAYDWSSPVTEDVVLYAKWVLNTYTVSVPTSITWDNMSAGLVNESFNNTVSCSGDNLLYDVKVTSEGSQLTGGLGVINVMSNSHDNPIIFTGTGSVDDMISLSGGAYSVNTWEGIITYTANWDDE